MVAAGKPNLLGVGRDGNLNAEHRAQRTEMSRRIDTGLELQRLMKMPLPIKMEDALRWYFDLEAAAHATGVKRGWEVIEAWLGTHDLFYLLAVLLNRHDIIKPWLFARCREVQEDPNDHLDLWAREHYKDQSVTTPVLTANRGWVDHGELVPGDMIFAPSGNQVRVIAVTEHYKDSECYRLTFSDGAQIAAGAGHLWRVRRKIRRRSSEYPTKRRLEFSDEVIHTEGMYPDVGGRLKRFDVGTCAPLVYPEAALPLDPYVLGVWLGDGNSSGVRVTAGASDADAIESAIQAVGVMVTRASHSNCVSLRLGTGIRGQRTSSDVANALRSLGVMNNKHIPDLYMTASIDQRMALLQGLMDTDGHCDKRGTATFVQADGALSVQVYNLAASLGLQPRLRGYLTFFQVSFQAHTDRNPFRMPRKAALAIPPSHYRGCRTLTKIEKIPSIPTNCIQVDGGLYCSGLEHVPTHNSTIITFGLTIYDILKDPEITVGIFSHTSSIATAFLRQIKMELETNERLYALYPDVLYQWPARESPKWSEKEGIIVKRKSNPKEATIEAWGLVDGQPTSKHFKLRVYDDVVTRESVQTPEAIKKTLTAWELSDNLGVSARAGGRVRYIGTRYSLYDCYSSMIIRKVVKTRLHPATHNGRFDGSPVFLSEQDWQTKVRTQGRSTIAAQLLQNPMADEGASFRPEWLRAYEVRPRTLNVYIMCDPSRGRSATSDNTAIAVVGIGAGGTKYLLDGACHRMTLSQRWLFLRGFYRRWSAVRGVQRVAVGYERYGAQSDDEYFQEQMELDYRRKVPDAFFQIEELNWPREGGNSKQDRVERLEPDFRNGRFFLPLSVMHEGKPSRWKVDSDPSSRSFGVIEYQAGAGLTRLQMQALEGGSPDLICKPIIVRDPSMPGAREGGGRYDVTTHFMDEYMLFPFGQWKDLIDSVSRIYDMDPTAPLAPSARTSSDPTIYADGV